MNPFIVMEVLRSIMAKEIESPKQTLNSVMKQQINGISSCEALISISRNMSKNNILNACHCNNIICFA